jgi:hypothetical protein
MASTVSSESLSQDKVPMGFQIIPNQPPQIQSTPVTRAAMIPKAESLSQFTLFPLLSAELRVKIWRLTVEPRLVILRIGEYLSTLEPLNGDGSGLIVAEFTSNALIPAPLHVCRESRAEFARMYQLSFSINAPKEMLPNNAARIWFNFAIDTLVLPTCCGDAVNVLRCVPKRDTSQIKRMAVVSYQEWFNSWESQISFATINNYPKLEKLIVIHCDCLNLPANIWERKDLSLVSHDPSSWPPAVSSKHFVDAKGFIHPFDLMAKCPELRFPSIQFMTPRFLGLTRDSFMDVYRAWWRAQDMHERRCAAERGTEATRELARAYYATVKVAQRRYWTRQLGECRVKSLCPASEIVPCVSDADTGDHDDDTKVDGGDGGEDLEEAKENSRDNAIEEGHNFKAGEGGEEIAVGTDADATRAMNDGHDEMLEDEEEFKIFEEKYFMGHDMSDFCVKEEEMQRHFYATPRSRKDDLESLFLWLTEGYLPEWAYEP